MNPFSPFYSNCELPMFERAGVGDWARYLMYQITQSGTAGRDARRFIGTRSLVHLRHYKERGLSKGEYVVAELHRPGDQGDSDTIYLRIERGGPEPEHMAAIELHLRDFASRQERYAARDSVEIIHALPSTDELVAQAVWGEKARHPTLIQLALACFNVHKADPGCFWGKAQSFFFAANVVMLLAEEFGVEYQRISHTAGMWAGFCIYSAPPHAADTLRVTFKQDIKLTNKYLTVDDDSPTDVDAQVKEYTTHLESLQRTKAMMDLLKDDLDAIEQALDTKMAIADLVKPATNDSKPNEGMHHLPEDTTTHGLFGDMTPFIDRMQGAATRIKGLHSRVLEVGRKLQEVDDQGQSLVQPADGNGASGAQA